VQLRATLLAGDALVDQAFDPYVFVRDAYLQRRSYLIKESEEKHVTKFVDEKGIVHRRHRSISVDSVVSK
jgi:ABC-type transporter lipoprotein component MlaA